MHSQPPNIGDRSQSLSIPRGSVSDDKAVQEEIMWKSFEKAIVIG